MINLEQTLLSEITAFNNKEILIGVYGSGETLRNFAQKPYFKVYNHQSAARASMVARIYFDEAKYVYPEHSEKGKKCWYFNANERKMIDKILSNPDVWGQLIMALNSITGLNVWYSKPNYRELREE